MKQVIINSDWESCIHNIQDNSIDLLLTDPPFGMNFQSNYRMVKHKKIHNDDNLTWLKKWVLELNRVLKKDAHLYVFCSWHNVDIFKTEISVFFNIKNILIWEKNNTGMGDLKGDYAPQYEMIIFCSNGGKKLNGRRDSNIIKSKKTRNELHPTQKPSELINYLIRKSSKEDDVVLDTFGGSCSVAIESKKLKRNCICIEIEESYCRSADYILKQTPLNLF